MLAIPFAARWLASALVLVHILKRWIDQGILWWIDYCGMVYISFIYGTNDRHNIAYPVTQIADSGVLALDVQSLLYLIQKYNP